MFNNRACKANALGLNSQAHPSNPDKTGFLLTPINPPGPPSAHHATFMRKVWEMPVFPLQPLAVILRTLPDALHTEFLGRFFNHLLQGQPLAEQLQALEGKCLSLVISDADTELLFLINKGQLQRCPRARQAWNVRIKGRLEDFWLLATRREDPDTLFFNRQLALEGETEAGLYLKNMLDALEFDWQAHLLAVLGPGPGTRVAQLIESGRSRR